MKTALITGANRGIGLELLRQLKSKGYYVIGCCRNPDEASHLSQLADEVLKLDVSNDKDIANLKNSLQDRPIDLLINNAGIIGENGVTVGNVNRDNFLKVLNINCISPIKLCDALLDNVAKSQEKGIVAISSQMGSISDNQSGRSYAYRSSKAALNCVMRSFAIDVAAMGVNVMLIHPGWVKTAMGGDGAPVDVQTSVIGILKQIESHLQGSHAEKLRRFDGDEVAW